MAAAPAPVIPRQYDIEIGPWDATGRPARTVRMSDIQTNSSYTRRELMPGVTPGIPVGLMFSTGLFFTNQFESKIDPGTF